MGANNTNNGHTQTKVQSLNGKSSSRPILAESVNLAECGPLMTWMVDAAKQWGYFSSSWLAFTGRSLNAEMGDGWLKNVHPDDLGQVMKVFADLFEVQSDFEIRFRLRHADGGYRWVLALCRPRHVNNAVFAGYVGFCIDFSRQLAPEGAGGGLAQREAVIEAVGALVARVLDAGKGARKPNSVAAANSYRPDVEIAHGTETILVLEDDLQVRNFVVPLLRRSGYVALEAADGDEARSICKNHGAPINLLLTDLVIAILNDRSFVKQLVVLQPEMRLLYMSGFISETLLQREDFEQGPAFLEKPFTAAELKTKIRSVLDKTQAPA